MTKAITMPCVKIAVEMLSFLLTPAISVRAQQLPDSVIKRIDHLFSQWNRKNTPGCIVGVVRNDSLVFAKGYGMANLEYGTPISENTVFYIASVSKQFTGYSISLLARQKKLNLDEDIRVYLPWFPDLKKKVTVRNLLNHTSGIRDHLNMIAISGLGIDGVLTNEHVVRVLKRQQGLNFNPGERYSYSNSNYILLAEIIKAVSGQSLRQFADSAIFKPLHMANTHFHDDPSELVANRAVSYWQVGNNTYANAFQTIYTVGDGGMMTTVKDASKWIMNFYDTKAGDSRDIGTLTTTGRLAGGKQLSYAAGITVQEKNGWQVYSHGGGLHGYSAMMTVYPELKTGFIILGNIRGTNKANDLAELIIPKKKVNDIAPQSSGNNQAMLTDSIFLKKYEGEYMSDDGYLLKISWKEGQLFGSGFGQEFRISGKKKRNTFLFPSKNNPLTEIVFTHGMEHPEFYLEFPDEILHFTRLSNAVMIKPADLTGEYYSPELDCTYKIILKNGELFLSNAMYPDSKLMLREAHLKRDSWFMSHMKVILDQNRVTGFEVNAGNVMHLRFNKVK